MSVSSNSLFHFTPTANYLINILKKGFVPCFSLEKFVIDSKTKEYAIPMICFCDIPLSQVSGHMSIYGQYGIGMSKQWAINNGLNPVIYIQDHSKLNKYTRDMSNEIWRKKCSVQCGDEIVNLKSLYWHIMRYTKRFEGDLVRNGIIKDANYKFYNEREWRYTPEVNDLTIESRESFYLKKVNFENEVTRKQANDSIRKYKLNFNADDIEYIILKNKDELNSMIQLIKEDPSIKSDKLKLISKLFTSEQITMDL